MISIWSLASICSAQTNETGGLKVASATPAESRLLAVAGNDEILWLVVGRPGDQQGVPVYRFARMEKSSSRIRPASRIRPQKGTLQRYAAVGPMLHAFFGADALFDQNGAHFSYDATSGGPKASLPGPVMPVAIAGEPTGTRPRLWAVVTNQTAEALQPQPAQVDRNAGTQPVEPAQPDDADTVPEALADMAPPSMSRTDTAPDEPVRFHLVQYDGVRWQPGFPAPDRCASAERVRLAVGSDRRFHLIWQPQRTEPVLEYAWHDEKGWHQGPSLAFDIPPADLFVGIINRTLIVAGLVVDKTDPLRCRCTLYAWNESANDRAAWTKLPSLSADANGTTDELLLPVGSAVGGFSDKLVIMQPTADGAEVAFYSPLTGGAPTEPFQSVPLADAVPGTPSQRGLRDLAATFVVAAMLLLVFWRRQESATLPVPLPAGMLIAGPGKRALAALIDMLPAAVIVMIFWHGPLTAFSDEFWPAFKSGQSEMLEAVVWPETLTWAWVAFRLIYVGYCIAWEILGSATPGKRLVRCEVRLETFEKTHPLNIVIRNITKLIELEPYLQIWPFMLVIFFTRNHQRVGDLLAKTIVIEKQQIVMDEDESDNASDPNENNPDDRD